MKKLLVGLITMLFVAGCGGELSYKRGASVRDLERAKHGCMSAGDEASYTSCMQQQGWTISALDDTQLFAHASITESTPQAKPKANVPASHEQRQIQTESSTAPSIASTEIPVASPSPAAKPRQTAPTPPPDESTPYTISSWWKFGGNPEMLKRDMNACEIMLGATHKPDSKTQVYTRAFLVCMYQKGWKGLKANKT